jgi:hypothetical protein
MRAISFSLPHPNQGMLYDMVWCYGWKTAMELGVINESEWRPIYFQLRGSGNETLPLNFE